MNEETAKAVASQLRKPAGDMGIEVGLTMNTGNLYINQYVINILKSGSPGNVLEIGMGNGYFVKDILAIDSSVRYSGCDYSETMIEEATKMNRAFIDEGRVRFDLSTASSMPYADTTFDTVFTINTVYFWENPDKELAEIRRVLKPTGQFIIAIRPKHAMEKFPFVKHGFNMFSSEDLSEVLKKNQFNVTDILEQQEPEIEFKGQPLRGESLIITAVPA